MTVELNNMRRMDEVKVDRICIDPEELSDESPLLLIEVKYSIRDRDGDVVQQSSCTRDASKLQINMLNGSKKVKDCTFEQVAKWAEKVAAEDAKAKYGKK